MNTTRLRGQRSILFWILTISEVGYLNGFLSLKHFFGIRITYSENSLIFNPDLMNPILSFLKQLFSESPHYFKAIGNLQKLTSVSFEQDLLCKRPVITKNLVNNSLKLKTEYSFFYREKETVLKPLPLIWAMMKNKSFPTVIIYNTVEVYDATINVKSRAVYQK